VNVLITSASRKVWLVDAFRTALRATGNVIATDITRWAAAMHRADRALALSRSDQAGFVDELVELCESQDISLLIPTRDEELLILADSSHRFNEVGTWVHVSTPDAVETCLDKRRFHDFCLDGGFPVPEMISDPSSADLPLFVRPRRGKGSVGIGRLDRPEQLAEIANRSDDVIINRFVDAPEYTIDVFLSRDQTKISSVPRERMHVVAGESYIARTTNDPALRDAAAELCVALGLRGHNTVQAFRWSDGWAFIEVNPRFGGGAALGFAAGAPSPTWLVQESRGEPLSPPPGSYQSGLVMLRYTEDVFVQERDLAHDPH